MSCVYGCTLTSSGLAAALLFGSWQGDQKQREPSFQRVRGTKCSKRGLPMIFVYGCTLTSFGLAAALRFGSWQGTRVTRSSGSHRFKEFAARNAPKEGSG